MKGYQDTPSKASGEAMGNPHGHTLHAMPGCTMLLHRRLGSVPMGAVPAGMGLVYGLALGCRSVYVLDQWQQSIIKHSAIAELPAYTHTASPSSA